MTKLIINADDFGYSKGVNLGIIEAYQNGVVTSTTLMANMPGAQHAAGLAKKNPGLGVGIHFVLTCGRPVSKEVFSLVNSQGEFNRISAIEEQGSAEEIELELTSQFEKFLSFGIKPTHIDSHHHVHSLPNVYPAVEKIARENQLPIRKVSSDPNQLQPVQYFNHEFYGDQLTTEYLIGLLDKALLYETAELMTHPAFVDEQVYSGSSYALQRIRELTILTDPAVQEAITERGIDLITFREVSIKSMV
ncbi:chitin disaccharide deacetylase [Bacillus infantis]|uniref:chitin disaccharide deacetylase n=1 Tax=Bacillus infantis TaxID=324767 RepID=UPI003CEC09D7